MKKRFAVVCALCITFVVAFGPTKGIKANEGTENDPAEETVQESPETPAEETIPEAPAEEEGSKEPESEKTAEEVTDDTPAVKTLEPAPAASAPEEAVTEEPAAEEQSSEAEEETATEAEFAALTLEIVNVQGTPYEIFPEEIPEGEPAALKPHYNKILHLVNPGVIDAISVHIQSPVLSFALGEAPAQTDLLIPGAVVSGTDLYLGLIRTDLAEQLIEQADFLAADPEYIGSDPYEAIALEISADNMPLQRVILTPADVMSIFDPAHRC